MQLNIYVPKEKSEVLAALDRAAELTGRPKNEIVLEALERHLLTMAPIELGRFNLGEVSLGKRSDIYEERLSRS